MDLRLISQQLVEISPTYEIVRSLYVYATTFIHSISLHYTYKRLKITDKSN